MAWDSCGLPPPTQAAVHELQEEPRCLILKDVHTTLGQLVASSVFYFNHVTSSDSILGTWQRHFVMEKGWKATEVPPGRERGLRCSQGAQLLLEGFPPAAPCLLAASTIGHIHL